MRKYIKSFEKVQKKQANTYKQLQKNTKSKHSIKKK